ncbi:hypothetical protein QFC22_003020 [Naganishia vaughanmartiniae]|uniref:Uncharacterized protein n=1 Tax=Naganishia vaughanmartiniae TaxID=1424756 RepID=A0ACC2XBK3_9TREE|nr:hypothetical protein QFC22_003020 [Naganishia vaughanmartiniae]
MGNQVGSLQRNGPEQREAGGPLSSQIIDRATRLHRHYFPLAPQSPVLSIPLTPDTTTAEQVCVIRMCLCQILPEELVNPILDYAEVSTVSVSERRERVAYQDRQGAVWAIQDRQQQERHWIYLVSKPIFGRVLHAPRVVADEDVEEEGESDVVAEEQTRQEEAEEVPEDPNERNPWKVKSVKVRTWSSDQGWTSEHFETDGKQFISELATFCSSMAVVEPTCLASQNFP